MPSQFRIFFRNASISSRVCSFWAQSSTLRFRYHSATTTTNKRRIVVTTPIFYANARPHIGHVYTVVLADVLCRWFRISGHDAVLTTGLDEHGNKVEDAARARGISSVQQHCDILAAEFQDVFYGAGIEDMVFTRTSSELHQRTVHELWHRLEASGSIELGKHEGWYCRSEEAFVADSNTTMLKGLRVDASSLKPVERVSEENYMFSLPSYESSIRAWIDSSPDTISPMNRRNEAIAMLDGGLEPLSISRRRDRVRWGIPVPGHHSGEHTIYVWIDALANYLTATRAFEVDSMWPVSYHIIGKDILRFHAIYWPALLRAASLPMPKRLITHAHWLCEGRKMSKSEGNIGEAPAQLLRELGTEPVRWGLLREAPLADDGDFSVEQFALRWKQDLCGQLGNLVSRASALLPAADDTRAWDRDRLIQRIRQLEDDHFEDEHHRTFHAASLTVVDRVDELYRAVDIRCALGAIMSLIQEANGYISRHEPWRLRLKDPDTAFAIVCRVLDAARVAAILMQPAVPLASHALLEHLQVPLSSRTTIDARDRHWTPNPHTPRRAVLFQPIAPLLNTQSTNTL